MNAGRYASVRDYMRYAPGQYAHKRGNTVKPKRVPDAHGMPKATKPVPKAPVAPVSAPKVSRTDLWRQANALLRDVGYYTAKRERKPGAATKRNEKALERSAAQFEQARRERERRFNLARIGQLGFGG
jgi:hypothetical protein